MDIKDIVCVFDFDKTLVSVEGLDLLAEICLSGSPHKERIVKSIIQITEQGMNGTLSFEESLKRRFSLINPTMRNLCETSEKLITLISPSIRRNKSFFQLNRERIYIVSGGFKEFIVPVAKELGLRKDHVYANTMITNAKGVITGFDSTNPLAHNEGKVHVVRSLHMSHVIAVGDGFTDAQIKVMGAAQWFVAFTEHVTRENVVRVADAMISNFDEFAFTIRKYNN